MTVAVGIENEPVRVPTDTNSSGVTTVAAGIENVPVSALAEMLVSVVIEGAGIEKEPVRAVALSVTSPSKVALGKLNVAGSVPAEIVMLCVVLTVWVGIENVPLSVEAETVTLCVAVTVALGSEKVPASVPAETVTFCVAVTVGAGSENVPVSVETETAASPLSDVAGIEKVPESAVALTVTFVAVENEKEMRSVESEPAFVSSLPAVKNVLFEMRLSFSERIQSALFASVATRSSSIAPVW